MRTLNIIINNIQEETKLTHNLYKDSLNDILDNNIDKIMAKTVYTKPGPPQDVNVLQLLEDFSQASSRKD